MLKSLAYLTKAWFSQWNLLWIQRLLLYILPSAFSPIVVGVLYLIGENVVSSKFHQLKFSSFSQNFATFNKWKFSFAVKIRNFWSKDITITEFRKKGAHVYFLVKTYIKRNPEKYCSPKSRIFGLINQLQSGVAFQYHRKTSNVFKEFRKATPSSNGLRQLKTFYIFHA